MVSYNNPKENTTADPGFPIGQGVPTYDTVAFRQKMGWAGVGAGTAGAGAGTAGGGAQETFVRRSASATEVYILRHHDSCNQMMTL